MSMKAPNSQIIRQVAGVTVHNFAWILLQLGKISSYDFCLEELCPETKGKNKLHTWHSGSLDDNGAVHSVYDCKTTISVKLSLRHLQRVLQMVLKNRVIEEVQ